MSGSRIVAAIGGMIAMGLVSAISFGTALLAPLGMWIAARIMRREQQPLTRFTSWLGAFFAVGMVIMVAAAVSIIGLTVGEREPAVQRAIDSATAANREKPPPAWLERIAPGSAARAKARPVPTGTSAVAIGVGGGIIGAVMLGAIAGLVIGSLAWAACLPLYYAINGRWLGQAPSDSQSSGEPTVVTQPT